MRIALYSQKKNLVYTLKASINIISITWMPINRRMQAFQKYNDRLSPLRSKYIWENDSIALPYLFYVSGS